ncbi:hypothetical protein [Microbacterium sp.]|uniref:hypothetical protein n=1 Tax=Microbacterium sp. TaxID=51671 RepID=UPI003F9D00C3
MNDVRTTYRVFAFLAAVIVAAILGSLLAYALEEVEALVTYGDPGSYDPHAPLRLGSESILGMSPALGSMLGVVLFIGHLLFAVLLPFGAAHMITGFHLSRTPLARGWVRKLTSQSATGAGVLGAVVFFVGAVVLSLPATDTQPVDEEHVAEWADGRYGLSLSEDDIGTLLDSRDGDPLLLDDGSMVHLESVGDGYVIVGDSELPRVDIAGDE